MSSRQSLTEQLYRHAVRYGAPFRAEYGQACVSIPFGTFTQQVAPVQSARVRDWLAVSFLREHNMFPSRQALRDTIDMLQAQALCGDFPTQPVDLRIGSRGHRLAPEAILIDLANADAEAIRMTADGWEITSAESHTFRRSGSVQPLPRPTMTNEQRATTNGLLPPAFPLAPADRARVTAWLLAAIRPTGPYPILVLRGPSASGKTTFARMLRALLDPSVCPLSPLPQSERELLDLAWNNRIIALNHVSQLPAALHDPLCRLASGGGFELRESAHDPEPLRLTLERPVLITVPSETPQKVDWPVALQNLALTVELSEIEPERLRDERDLWAEFEAARPGMLAAMCTAVGTALANVGTSTYEAAPRLPHLARWAAAAAPALSTTRQEFLAALVRDPLAIAISDFVRESTAWSGTAAELLAILQSREVSDLPATPKALNERLHRASLHTLGIEFDSQGKEGALRFTTQPVKPSAEKPSFEKTIARNSVH